MIFVVDFGGQTAHLISRRIRELGVETKIIHPEEAFNKGQEENPQGIIFSGGPSSVYEKGAPSIDPKIFALGIPILGICYGLQLIAHLLGGKVISGRKEYGPAKCQIPNHKSQITNELPQQFTVWMSHGDEVVKIPKGFEVLGSTEHVPFALVQDQKRKIFGLQFHPEVEHTEYGLQILNSFINVCDLESNSNVQSKLKIATQNSKVDHVNVKDIESNIRKIVGEKDYVIGAVSGGVDSTVAAALTAKAIGKRFIPIYVDNGLMREGTKEHIEKICKKIGTKSIVVNREKEMLNKLKNITDSEKKRQIIGNFYIEIFEKEMAKLLKKEIKVQFLLQGTIYSDVIESQGTRHAAKIKSHHNVGGLPKKMKLKLLEPLRFFYKDEIRQIGHLLGLPEEFINRQPFPGPGYAIRIRGKVTKKRLAMEKQADKIVLEELKKANVLDQVFLSFPVLTGAFSTAVKGDGRHFGEVVAVRIIESKDIMTSNWVHVPYEVLQKISSRIVNEVPNVSRVVYDITTKPPATMEWE